MLLPHDQSNQQQQQQQQEQQQQQQQHQQEQQQQRQRQQQEQQGQQQSHLLTFDAPQLERQDSSDENGGSDADNSPRGIKVLSLSLS
jgi:Ca-activated chloride channel family protein